VTQDDAACQETRDKPDKDEDKDVFERHCAI
jgi:hypothetical protein